MKIAVYAISKNEEQFVKRFCESAKQADLILIADTGSTDNTVEEAKKHNATVYDICISPWRFDKARDTALSLIPKDYDVCISLDLDEVLESGWREEIENVWGDGTTRMQYLFDWSNGIKFYSDKIHSRHGYFWKHPCHETLTAEYRTKEKWVKTDKLLISHYPDESKSRGQYINLLEVASNEDKECPRNAFYYARELVFTRQHQKAIPALKKYLDMPKSSWAHERSYAMRLLGECFSKIDSEKAIYWYRLGCVENPNAREPWYALAKYCYENSLWEECFYACNSALKITNKEFVYTMNPDAWGYQLHDLLAISAYNLGNKFEAIKHGEIAISLSPDNTRLIENLSIIRRDMSYDFDPIKYGVLWQKVEGYEEKFTDLSKKMEKMESNIEKLLENQAQQKGASWLAIGMLSVLSTIGGWLLHWWSK